LPSYLPLVRTVLFLGCALALMAQSESPRPDSQKPDSQPPDSQQTDLPQPDSQPADSTDAGAGAEYSGPAILSRGQSPSLQNASPIAFRPFIGLNGTYDTGLTPVAVSTTGHIPSTDSYGEEVSLGAYTYRKWKHTTLSLDYHGDFRRYSTNNSESTDHSLGLSLTREVTGRATVTLREQGGIFSQNNFLASTLGPLDSSYLPLPGNSIYNNRTIFAGVSADMSYLLTPLLSFSIGANGSLVRRESSALYGSTSGGARGDLQYRMSRHTTIGIDYNYTYFDYTRGFGDSEVQSLGMSYSAQLSPHLQLSASVGGARIESTSLTTVTLDPAIAALLGETQSVQAAYRLNYAPDMQARLASTFRRSQFSLGYVDQISPGNGVYLASKNSSGSLSYGYSGVHYWSFGASASYGRMTSLVQTLGAYTTYGGGGGVTRELGKGVHAVLHVGAFHNDIAGGSLFRRAQYSASLGLSFSPGDVPLVLW
jgi:hypothetical protein